MIDDGGYVDRFGKIVFIYTRSYEGNPDLRMSVRWEPGREKPIFQGVMTSDGGLGTWENLVGGKGRWKLYRTGDAPSFLTPPGVTTN